MPPNPLKLMYTHMPIKKWPEISGHKSWLPGVHDLWTTSLIDSISYVRPSPEKSPLNEALEIEKADVVNRRQHIIHKAIGWKKMLDDGEVESLSEIAEKEGLTRARVTQIMNLLKLSPEWKNFLLGAYCATNTNMLVRRKYVVHSR